MGGPWGERPPRRPKVGAGRTALAKRAKARGGRESRASAVAARRGLSRGTGNRRARKRVDPGALAPMRRGWGVLAQHTRHLQQRFLAQRRLRHLVVAIALGWVAWTFLLGDASLPRLLALRHRNAKLEGEVTGMETEQSSLETDVRALEKGDRAMIERIARDEHAMVKDGEILVRFYDPEDTAE